MRETMKLTESQIREILPKKVEHCYEIADLDESTYHEGVVEGFNEAIDACVKALSEVEFWLNQREIARTIYVGIYGTDSPLTPEQCCALENTSKAICKSAEIRVKE
jgi:hypothetical protein